MIRRLFAISTIIFTSVLVGPKYESPTEAAYDQTTIKVGWATVPGLSYYDEYNQEAGILFDYLAEISNYTDWKYEFIHYDYFQKPDDTSPNGMAEDFYEGKIDFLGGQYMVDDARYAYPHYNAGYSRNAIVTSWDSDIVSYDLSTLNGKTIAVFKRAATNINYLINYLASIGYGVKSDNLFNLDLDTQGSNGQVTVKGYLDSNLYQYIDNGEADMVLSNLTNINNNYNAIAIFNSQPYYIVYSPTATNYGTALNNALEAIYDSTPTFGEDLMAKHFNVYISANVNISQEEKNYVESLGPLKVALPRYSHPFFCLNEQNKQYEHNGIISDILKKITETSGITFEYELVETHPEAVTKVKDGDADILGFYFGDNIPSINEEIAVTVPYLSITSALVKNQYTSYPSEGLKAGVIRDSHLPNDIHVEEENIVYYDKVETALEDLNNHRIDLFYGVSASIEQIVQDNNFININTVPLSNNQENVRFGLTRPSDTTLLRVLNKSIGLISDEDKAEIISSNILSVGITSITLATFLKQNPIILAIVAIVGILIIAVFLFLIYVFKMRSATLKLENVKVEAENKAKTDFLSHMSHEIRTPMNALVGLTNLAEINIDNPEVLKSNLSKMHTSANYLLNLLNDVLDMSKLDSNKMVLASDPFSMRKSIEEVIQTFDGQISEKKIKITLDYDLKNDYFLGDDIRLKQVLNNLLSNAVKFTPSKGKITVTFSSIKVEDKYETIKISVKDTGKGIEEENKEKIFKIFEQAGTNYSNSQGTGLGLPICSSLVSLMGGELKVDSKVNEGSDFYFQIKLEITDKEMVSEEEVPINNVHILLAEDNDLNSEIACEMLTMHGGIVTRVKNGEEAVEMIRSQGALFDIILMDLHMPIMNGLEASKAIRKLQDTHAQNIPIVALTANVLSESKKEAYDSGMNGFITKPIDIVVLSNTINKLVNKQ